MANPVKGEVAFDADGKNYVLRWTTNAICELEAQTGRSVNSIARELGSWAPKTDANGNPIEETEEQTIARSDLIRVGTARSVFWAMLRDRQDTITLKQAGDLIEAIGGLEVALPLIVAAFERGNAPETKGARPPETPKA